MEILVFCSCNQCAQELLLKLGVLKNKEGIIARTPEKVGRKDHGNVSNIHLCAGRVLWLRYFSEEIDEVVYDVAMDFCELLNQFLCDGAGIKHTWQRLNHCNRPSQTLFPSTLFILANGETSLIQAVWNQRLSELTQPEFQERARNVRVCVTF